MRLPGQTGKERKLCQGRQPLSFVRQHLHPREPRAFRAVAGPPLLVLSFLIVLGLVLPGCTRTFYRTKADAEVSVLLDHMDVFAEWELHNYYVYPHPLARFADPTDPDHPPMPPDDPAAWLLAAKPQKPKHVAYIEGLGYLELLAAWDAENRAKDKQKDAAKKPAGPPEKYGVTPPAAAPPTSIPPAAPPPAGAPTQPSVPPPPAEILKTSHAQVAPPTPPVVGPPPQAPVQPATPGEVSPEELPPPAGATPEESCSPWGRREPFLINLEQSVELGYINSREFQARREDLYLTALPVTLQRFAFLPQFEAVNTTIREWAGRESTVGKRNRWESNSTLGMSQLFTTGALLTLQLANRTIVNLTGREKHTISESTLFLDLIQPLLRGGGRAVTLEPLTQSERDLVYELRNFARFHREFFVAIAAGRPIQSSGGVGGVAGLDLGVRGQAAFVGYLPTLGRLVNLEYSRTNVEAFTELLDYYRASEAVGTVSALQVDLVEQNLLTERLAVLQNEVLYGNALDQFKIQLGVPTDLPLELDRTPLRPILDQIQRIIDVEANYAAVIRQLDEIDVADEPMALRPILLRILMDSPLMMGTRFQQQVLTRWRRWQSLFSGLDQSTRAAADMAGILTSAATAPGGLAAALVIAPRQSPALLQLEILQRELARLQQAEFELESRQKPVPAALQSRLAEMQLEVNIALTEQALRVFETAPWRQFHPDFQKTVLLDRYRRVVSQFALLLEGARSERTADLDQSWPELPPMLVNGVDILKLPEEEAQNLLKETAFINRLDLMNRRAQVVDAWRQIAVFANALLGTVDLQYHMELMTPRNEAQPLRFQGTNSRHQFIINTELPLVRQLERNNYRASLIAYQRQRRSLMAEEDRIQFQVRTLLRDLREAAETYKIQQRALVLAFRQVDQAQQGLRAPPEPGRQVDLLALTQQLVQNQSGLPRRQNQVVDTYIGYLIARMELYRDLELLRVDSRGVWIDEYSSANGTDRHRDRIAPPCPPTP